MSEIVQGYLKETLEWAQRACDLEEENKNAAEECYQRALLQLNCALSFEQNPLYKYLYNKLMSTYQTRMQQIQHSKKNEDKLQPNDCIDDTVSIPLDSAQNETMSEYLLLEENLTIKSTNDLSWNDVAGLDQAISSLQEAIILPSKFPHFFTGKRAPWKSILLFGPPGTGKTHLASVLASEAKVSFLSISAADILSKWLGQSEKIIRQIFELARKKKPCVMFFDEIDAICSARNDQESETSRRVKTEFLVQMQGIRQDCSLDGVLILAATNLPWDLDPAVLRRFQKRIYVPLPNQQARLQLIKQAIGDTPHILSEQDMNMIAEKTKDYSGSDISSMIQEALMIPIRKIQQCKLFVKTENQWHMSEQKNNNQAVRCSLHELEGSVATPKLCMSDVLQSLDQTSPTVKKELMYMYEQYMQK